MKETLISKNDTYGGCYIDDNGNLNIWYTNNLKEYKNTMSNDVKESQSIVYRKAEYTFAELESVSNKLFYSMEKLGIDVISIDEVNNRVQVVMSSAKYDKKAVIECVGEKDILVFDYIVSKPEEHDTVIKNGSGISSSAGSFSVCVGAVRNGRYGFITAGHCYNTAGSVYYNGSLMGTFRACAYNNYTDVAFIERSMYGNYKATNLFTDNTGYTKGSMDYVVGGFPVGTSVTKYGAETGKTTGKIVSTNLSILTQSGVALQKMVSATYFSDAGDSGGAIKAELDVGGLGYTYCIGIHHGSYTSGSQKYGVFTDMTLAKNALNFQRYYD